MEESLVSVEPTASVREAAQKMRHHSISSILIGESGNYSGILTDIDLTRKFAAKNLDPDHTLVSIISNNPIITLMPTARWKKLTNACVIKIFAIWE